MKVIKKRAISVMLLAILALTVLCVSFRLYMDREWTNGMFSGGEPDRTVKMSGYTGGSAARFTDGGMVAENDVFVLAVDEKLGQVRLKSKRSGVEWAGIPPIDEKMSSNNKQYVSTPVLINYTTGVGTSQTYPLKEQGSTVKLEPLAGGVRVNFDLPALGMAFSVDYRLTYNGFEARIPYQSVKETGNGKLISVELLPFFHAATPADKGAIFVPDGSGALMKFSGNRPPMFDYYHEFIYGGDPVFSNKMYKKITNIESENVANGPKEYAALPVYGLYKADSGFLAIVTDGDTDAKINASPAGMRNINLFRVSGEFLYRNDDVVYIGSSPIPLVQRRMIDGDRAVRYVLLEKNESNYVAMAHAYHDYLVKEKGLKPVQGSGSPLQLRLFGGVKRKEIIGSTFIAMTTFEQARNILQQYLERGITSIEVTYDGWSQGGLYGNQPDHFPAENRLGGDKELAKLSKFAAQNGIRLYLRTNYVKPYEKSDAVKPSRDAVRTLNKEVLKVYRPKMETMQPSNELFYLFKPQITYNKYVLKEAEQFKGIGAYGVQLEYMGDLLYSDQDSKHFISRKGTMQTWINTMDTLRKKVGSVAVDYGYGYALGHVDRIDNIPLDSSHFVCMDETVPFYQIAVHGLIPYTAKPLNLSDDPQTEFLKILEYGALQDFVLTGEHSNQLQRTMVNGLFSTKYDEWLNASIDKYVEAGKLLNRIADQPIVNHERLNVHIFRTTYGNGTKVAVNYGNQPAVVDGRKIKPHDYTIWKGEDQR